ncbi:hypothetical protein HYH02_005100 [Chlamydomonas schloesseri]|uniref:Glycosyltransferase family 92 protein n=1 Tax=Chlamydomonas schloesseri TaxID=2026947 RepID=A0A835WLG9_9CHLO|nr:hypothetical protein HYH02_005100 [Chlamydomonas schloesseri]|eukprot:KAG2449567.1 hypothetical protein HYH02_005100 [Chlamydomonas schloesseri]
MASLKLTHVYGLHQFITELWQAPRHRRLGSLAATVAAVVISLLICSSQCLSVTAASAAAGASSRGGEGNYSALCAVGRNENRYVKEWVDYHKCLGFSRIYLYDHGSTVPMSEQLKGHIASGFLTYVNFSAAHRKFQEGYTSDLDRFMSTVQGQAYKHCVDTWGGRHTFIGFIDLDEFMVLYDPGVRSVNNLLRDYEQHPGLSIYWVLLGSSGHTTRPQAPVVESYTACTPHDHKFNTQFKTFVNTRFKPTMYSPHRAVFNASSSSSAAAANAAAAGSSPDGGLEPYMVNEHRQRIARGRNKYSTHERAAIFHYVTKSLEDFSEKMNRGGGAGVTRPKYYFTLMDRYSKATCDGALATRARFCGVPVPAAVQAKLDEAAAKGKTGRRRAGAKLKVKPA